MPLLTLTMFDSNVDNRYPIDPDVQAAAAAAYSCLDYWLAQELGTDDRPVPSVALELGVKVGRPMEGAFKTKHCTRLLWSLMQVNHRYALPSPGDGDCSASY